MTAYRLTYISKFGSPQMVLTMKKDASSYSIQHTSRDPAGDLVNMSVNVPGGSFNTLNPSDPKGVCKSDGSSGITCDMGKEMPSTMTIDINPVNQQKVKVA